MSSGLSRVKEDFPQLSDGRVYLDSATLGLPSKIAMNAQQAYYASGPSVPASGAHRLATRAGIELEKARTSIAGLFGARPSTLSFQPSVDLAAFSILNSLDWKKGDRIISTMSEYGSMLVPLTMLHRRFGVELQLLPADRELELLDFIDSNAKGATLLALSSATMVHSCQRDVFHAVDLARSEGLLTYVDASRTMGIWPFDVAKLEADFCVCAANLSLLAPDSTCLAFIQPDASEKLDPVVLGSGSARSVSGEDYEIAPMPGKMEVGLTNIGSIIGVDASLRHLFGLGPSRVSSQVEELCWEATECLSSIKGVELVGTSLQDADGSIPSGIVGFSIKGFNEHDAAMYLDEVGKISVRSGHMCSFALFESLGAEPALQLSFHAYNDMDDLKVVINAIAELARMVA